MGHLINPSSMRLGSLNYWKDLVYINKLYYPEYLHMIFKMRLFLISFFTFRIFELNEIIYSHFNFMRQNKNLIVKIYLYNGMIQNFINIYFLENKLYWNNCFRNQKIRDKHDYSFLNIFVIIFFVLSIKDKSWYKLVYNFRNIFKKAKVVSLKNIFLKIQLKQKRAVLFLLYIVLVLKLKYRIIYNFNLILYTFVISLIKNIYIKHVFNIINMFIINVFYKYFLLDSIIINTYIISNNNLNANFLARFIARKLKQSYTIKEIMRPIIKDLKTTTKLTSNRNNYYKYSSYKTKFVFIIKNIIIIYNKLYNFYYVDSSCWMSPSIFYNIFYIKYIIKNYLKRKILIYFYLKKTEFLHSFNKFKLFEIILYDFESSINLYFKQKSTVILFILNYFIKYNYYNYSYNNLFHYINYNNLKSRIKPINYEDNNILGFKFHFLGRFSRRQRSSSIWFIEGKMPLNTLKASIEYGYYTIPLLNSSIRVKVFIYRGNNYSDYLFKII